ncbi:tRNA guanosine(34) transglycosylase Tgt [Candidatus Woesearchaeota archaeon]|nr:tRNA guanosine(34) transglycosylase Tgt [Candidatus Woesearchaeota archaeon]
MNPFKITHRDPSGARLGKLKTAHGTIETPFFMPAATKATGKHITTDDYQHLGANVITKALIANAFILSLRPGLEIVQKAGGLHLFMNFPEVIFTDCGGFQMSRGMFEQKTKNGLHFRSPFDNQKVVLTPRKIMEIELKLGSDVAMMLDDMSSYGVSFEEAKQAMENTHRWGSESLSIHQALREHYQSKQLLFGIVQGNFYPELRKESAKFISALDFDGIAIGGVAIGEPLDKMYKAVDAALPFIPKNKIRYVMGVGSPVELLELIARGIDCFDSVYPTQNARHGTLFTREGTLSVKQGKYAQDFTPIETGCGCHTCHHYTKAYLRHLLTIDEPAAKRLLSVHNLYFVQRLILDAKEAIKEKRFAEFKEGFKRNFGR